MTAHRLLEPTALGERWIALREGVAASNAALRGGQDTRALAAETAIVAFLHGDMAAERPIAPIEFHIDTTTRRFDQVAPDYLQTTSKAIPLFSPRFVAEQKETLGDDVEFVPVRLVLEDGAREFAVARTLRRLPIIDADASEYRKLGPVRLRSVTRFIPLPEDAHVVRDADDGAVLVATDRFVALIAEHGYHVGHLPYR
ncbi:hypothetical protein [Actinocrispum wychmicini]|uniref:Uncharacterized protein n=1 Tax=Actinocrispum wychmicini TaxID=1213861 RepID=A0A4R2JAV0_9PSEU|nr:hypothetical protein [Actinocrispum wychmicini]TCO56583.1 hypothetical protein EV192_10656 [Actinocrispum wychmicini]